MDANILNMFAPLGDALHEQMGKVYWSCDTHQELSSCLSGLL